MAVTASAVERGSSFTFECARPFFQKKCVSSQGVHYVPLGLQGMQRKKRSSAPTFGPSISSHVGFARTATLSQVSKTAPSTDHKWLQVAASARQSSRLSMVKEEVFFDGGPHWGDLAVNLVFGISVLWLPLTVAAIARGLVARYRFTDQRVTIIGGFNGQDRRDFSYKEVKDVKYVPRFLGDWGDIVISLNNGDQIECQRIPKHKEIAKFVEEKAAAAKLGKAVNNASAKAKAQ